MPDRIKSAVVIGAGNVAWHLACALKHKNISIKQIISRTPESAKTLASVINTKYSVDLETIDISADVYFIAVTDDAVKKIIAKLKLTNQLVVHMAGSLPISIFDDYFMNYGVFYPYQTFTKTREIDFSQIPICVEANNPSNAVILINFAKVLSNHVIELNSEDRAVLHLAGVFASNFSNHMYSLAAHMLKKRGLDFKLLKPLITETAHKATELDPKKAQTGPAVRNNKNTMDKHLAMLKGHPELESIYEILSESIYNYSHEYN